MAAVTAASMDASTNHIQSEVHTYTETHERQVKKKKSTRKHKEEGSVSVSKSSEKIYKKMKATNGDTNPHCEKCARPVYAMERIKAEKKAWHKECFRCHQCNKQLTVETYESDHMTLYCKQHFKQLFEPKPVEEGTDQIDATPKKHQMIICESNPVELPPDVVRASDKPDLGLQELSQLDVKARFEVFEKKGKVEQTPVIEPKAPREKSTALLSKLAKFKAKGMDIGVSDEYLNGIPVEASSSEPEDEEEDADTVLRKSYKHTNNREQPVSFCNMSEIVGKFECGQSSDSERHRNRKQEIQNIRSRLFLGKQAKIKEMYEQSVMQSEQSITSAEKISKELELDSDKARSIKQRFESGQIFNDENQPPKNRELDDTTLFNEGIGKKSRSIFLELDANAKNLPPTSPPPAEAPKRKEIPFIPKDVVKCDDKIDDVHIETADISDRFKFFETYKPEVKRKEFRMTPPRQNKDKNRTPSPEPFVDPSVSREVNVEPLELSEATRRQTASRMIDVFRNMEEQLHRENDSGPKPLKAFTPPPEGVFHREESSSCEEEEESGEEEEDYHAVRERDEALQQAQQLARTKSFRSKFENWSENEPQRSPSTVVLEMGQTQDEDGESQLETAKSLRAKFESLTVQQSSVKTSTVPRVNRFV